MAAGTGDEIAFSRRTAVLLWRAVRIFAGSEVGGWAIAMAVGLLVLLLAINGLNVVSSYVGRDFMTAIERRDGAGFVRMAILYAAVFGLSTIVAVLYRFTEERLGLLWRHWLTHRLVRRYMADRLCYRLQAAGTLSNPDQRIADDVRSFTTSTLSLALIFLNGAFTLAAFLGVLWTIRPLLVAVAAGYALLGSLLAWGFGRPLVRLNYDQSDREASFRAELVHVRENAASVALIGREEHFQARLGAKVEAFTGNLRAIIAVNRNLGFFTTGYNYMIQLIPALIVAPLFIRGTAQFGEIPQASMAFAHVVGAFSLVVNQFGQLSSYAAVLARLTAFAEAVEAVPASGATDIVVSQAGAGLAVERLTLRAPHDARVLVDALSLDLAPGARVAVAGPRDATAALELAIAGMWPDGRGRIVRPAGVMFLPERPYLPPGTLRQLLVARTEAVGDDAIGAALQAAGVEAAVRRAGGLDAEADWSACLSLDEQRGLEIARMLLAAPGFVVLSGVDAALGSASAARVGDAAAARGIGVLALVKEVPDTARFDTVVRIAADGSWTRTGAEEAG